MDRVIHDGLSWAPSRAVFLRRVLITAAITFAVLSLVTISFFLSVGLPLLWGIAGALVITLGFVIEDATRWRTAKSDLWQVSEGHLIHDGDAGRAMLPLSEITSVSAQFGGRVSVRLSSGQGVTMRYLPYPRETAAHIDTLRQAK